MNKRRKKGERVSKFSPNPELTTLKPDFQKRPPRSFAKNEGEQTQQVQTAEQPGQVFTTHSSEAESGQTMSSQSFKGQMISNQTLSGHQPDTFSYQTHTLNRNSYPQLRTGSQQPAPNTVRIPPPAMPVNFILDSRGKEYCTVAQGQYYIGLDNNLENVRSPYTLAKYPVTKDDYLQFVIEEKISYSSEEIAHMNQISPYPNSPAVMVSWEDAKNYCRWLRRKTGDYYALPSIIEWEAAARGKDGRVYPWGAELPSHSICCFNDSNAIPNSTCTVDYYTNNQGPFGCIGMIGNVMEWTLDSFHDERDPHILKGGSWMSTIDFCNNVTPLLSFPSNKRDDFVGFRLLFLPKDMYQAYKSAHQK